MPDALPSTSPELDALLGFIERDPDNPALTADAARQAWRDGQSERAAEWLARCRTLGSLPADLQNLSGLIAMQDGDFTAAARDFQTLLDAGQDDPAIRFNRAWCHAMAGEDAAAIALLTGEAALAQPQAATLHIELLYRNGELDAALALAPAYAERFPDHHPLFAALASAAMDADDMVLARSFAEKAGDTPEGRTVRATALLTEERPDEALELFDAALVQRPDSARALLGRSMAQLARGDTRDALAGIERSAELFETHVGSWVAAGWLRLIAGDRAESRARFDRAMAIDDTFAENHGGLAVLDILDGDADTARRRIETALRLDRACFGAAMAQSLLLEREGDPDKGQRVLQLAMNAPAGPDGQTIGEALAAFTARR
ncbi:MAG: tetratricopeptide repeat protein [Pseudomonadota bacterium]